MSSAVKTLSFVTRWPNIPLWNVVTLTLTQGNCRAEYVSGSERQVSSNWLYDFLVQSADLPAGATLDDVRESNLVSPFVAAASPCNPPAVTCFASVPELGEGENYKLAVIVGPNDCGQWCLKQTAAPDQYEHGGTWDDHPGQPPPP